MSETRRPTLAVPTLVAAAWLVSASIASAQQVYELRVPGTATRSTARLSPRELAIVHQGRTTIYLRDPRFDVGVDRGYYNADLGQAIQWPARGQGPFAIGDVRGGRVAFRQSQMEIIPLADPVRVGRVPVDRVPVDRLPVERGVDGRHYYELAPPESLERGQVMQADPLTGRAELQWRDGDRPELSYWGLTDAGNGAFRLQTPAYPGMSLTATAGTALVQLQPTADDPRQLWRLERAGDGAYQIVNLAPANRGAALDSDSRTGTTTEERVRQRRVIDPRTGAERLVEEKVLVEVPRPGMVFMARAAPVRSQQWRLLRGPLIDEASARPGARRVVSRRLLPHSPLAPAEIQLTNSSDRELWVLWEWLDQRGVERIRIPARGAVDVSVPRDGGRLYEVVYEVYGRAFGGLGQWTRRTERVSLAPETLVRLSVYELKVQSISRDATAAGGGRIEEVNYSPRSLGMFVLPPGERLRDGQQIDVYEVARDAANPGAVTRIDPDRWR